MALLNGVHHLATLTSDLDRLIDFYQRVFDARLTDDMEEEGLRHAFIEIGPGTFLHPFQIPDIEVFQGTLPMFNRGRIDHVAFHASSEQAYRELRRRAVDNGASTGEVTDVGPLLSFSFVDPDGLEGEVVWVKPDDSSLSSGRRETWRTVDID
jgi:catechol 2,3-dioxygenase-like lactoylglutathione lyase family enzyme